MERSTRAHRATRARREPRGRVARAQHAQIRVWSNDEDEALKRWLVFIGVSRESYNTIGPPKGIRERGIYP